MIYVVALNYQEFAHWCRFVADPPVSPRDRAVMFVGTSYPDAAYHLQVMQIKQEELVYYGDYYKGKCYPQIAEMIRLRTFADTAD